MNSGISTTVIGTITTFQLYAIGVLLCQARQLSAVEYDVLSALINLGCNRPAAEAAVRKAKAAGAGAEFEPLFRKALELVR